MISAPGLSQLEVEAQGWEDTGPICPRVGGVGHEKKIKA